MVTVAVWLKEVLKYVAAGRISCESQDACWLQTGMVNGFSQYVETVRNGAACGVKEQEKLPAHRNKPNRECPWFKKAHHHGYSCPPDRELQRGSHKRS